jgi:hypothetical protein
MRRQGFRTNEERARLATERRNRIAQMWPVMSALEIGIELDMSADAVVADAFKAGLARRPIRMKP